MFYILQNYILYFEFFKTDIDNKISFLMIIKGKDITKYLLFK
jgi:hypothetical protein